MHFEIYITNKDKLQAERLFLVSANFDKTPHHTHLQHAKISQNHRDDQPPFLLTEPTPHPYRPFSAEAETNLSVCYILPEVGAWSNITTTSKLE